MREYERYAYICNLLFSLTFYIYNLAKVKYINNRNILQDCISCFLTHFIWVFFNWMETGIINLKNSIQEINYMYKTYIRFRNRLSTNVWNSRLHFCCNWYCLYHLDNLQHKQKVHVQFSGISVHKGRETCCVLSFFLIFKFYLL